MTNCKFCGKRIGFSENEYFYRDVHGQKVFFCEACKEEGYKEKRLEEKNPKIKCPACKEYISKKDTFCKNCGRKLYINVNKKPGTLYVRKSTINLIAAVVAIALILGILFLINPPPKIDTLENKPIIVDAPKETEIELKPMLEASFAQSSSNSVTSLKANGDNIGQITLTNIGNNPAYNVRIILSSPNGYFADKTINVGVVDTYQPITINVDLTFIDRVLDLTTDERITINADISYTNSENKEYTSEENFDMLIRGRNYISWRTPQMVASWVTPTQPTIRQFASGATGGLGAGMTSSDPFIQKMAARWLFESMRAYGVQYVNDAHSSADYIQFPYETLKNKAGDCEDQAVLYASLLESIGLDSFLIYIPGEHMFAGYVNSDGYLVPVETTGGSFDNALVEGANEYEENSDKLVIIKPGEAWSKYPQINLQERFELAMPSITKQKEDCTISFNLKDFFVASAKFTFVNSGNAPGAGCGMVATYVNGEQRDVEYKCVPVNPGETEEFIFQPDMSITEETYCVSK